MWENLKKSFNKISEIPDEENKKRIRELIKKFHSFNDGICIVHHFFDKNYYSSPHGNHKNEWCSMHGGCATCLFMKMNSLDGLMVVCDD